MLCIQTLPRLLWTHSSRRRRSVESEAWAATLRSPLAGSLRPDRPYRGSQTKRVREFFHLPTPACATISPNSGGSISQMNDKDLKSVRLVLNVQPP